MQYMNVVPYFFHRDNTYLDKDLGTTCMSKTIDLVSALFVSLGLTNHYGVCN